METRYTWLRYADDAQGNGMSDQPYGKEYMGLAHHKPTPEASDNPAEYRWSKIEHRDNPGPAGEPGPEPSLQAVVQELKGIKELLHTMNRRIILPPEPMPLNMKKELVYDLADDLAKRYALVPLMLDGAEVARAILPHMEKERHIAERRDCGE